MDILRAINDVAALWLTECKDDKTEKQYKDTGLKCLQKLTKNVQRPVDLVIHNMLDLELYGLKANWKWIYEELETRVFPASLVMSF